MGQSMEPTELQTRLTQLLPGETVLLSEKEFQEAFNALPGTDLRKRVARWFAEASDCTVLFMGEERVFAVFTKQPALA
jgi:hypothetical protein